MKTVIAVLALTTSMAVAQPTYIPDGKYIRLLAEFYRAVCEETWGGEYVQDFRNDLQHWSCINATFNGDLLPDRD